jgi:uncharacterized protein YndB with AHSA1/START domain
MASKNQTVVKVEPGKQELFITREFEARRELVFKAFTDAKLMARWFGPRDMGTSFDVFDGVSGGSWRSVQKDKDGNEFAFHGVHHEVAAPERIIWTFEFEGMPESGHVLLETIRFEELPQDRTRVTSQSVFQSVEDRDGMVAAGMEDGTVDSYEQLDELLEELKK